VVRATVKTLASAAVYFGVSHERSFYDDPVLYDRVSTPPAASIDFYVELARNSPGDVLELACGTGRVTIPIAHALSRSDRSVTGLDLAPAMLDSARTKAASVGVALDLVSGDMRRFALGRRFGLIFVAFNSLLHLTTNEALAECFGCVREHLAPRGTFAFDVFNPSVAMLARSPAERTTVVRVPDDALGEIHVEATMDYDAATQVNRSAFHFSAPGRPDYLTVPIHLRSLFPLELPLLLAANGLRLEERYGDFARERFGSGSARQVCICRVADATAPAR
jgi:SAM-dependent methyltransferase